MIWIKLQTPRAGFWLKMEAYTEIALKQVQGLELGAKLFASIPIRVVDTRYSPHPVEPTYDEETIRQLIAEEAREYQKESEDGK